MTKKSKLILGWSIPSALVVVAAGAILPTVIVLDSSKREVLNNSKNIYPTPFSSMSSSDLSNLEFNPRNYDFDFFWWNICSTPLVNSVFSFSGLTFDKEDNVWKSKEGVAYSIDKIELISSTTTNYVFTVSVKKTYNGIDIVYRAQSVTIPKSSFASSTQSKQNFVTYSAKLIHDLFLNNNLQVISNKETASNVSDFNSPTDINIKSGTTISTSAESIKRNQLASSFYRNESSNLYVTNNDTFKYDFNRNIYTNFAIPVSGKIWSSSEYKIGSNGELDSNDPGQIYNFLESEYRSGHLTYLPELTAKEKMEVQQLNSKATSDGDISAETKKRIQKLIFDPTYIPYSYNDNNVKIPLNTMQAIAVKVQLDDNAYTWLITWSNLLSISPNLVNNAAELDMIPTLKNNQELTYQEIQESKNYIYFEPTSTPINGLVYEVINVTFDNEDINKLNANVTVRVSHPEIETTKEYTIIVSRGFQSKIYVDLYNQVKSVTSNFTNMDSLKPTITIKENVTKEDIIKNYTNLNWLKNNLNFASASGITVQAVYTINWATLSNDSAKLLMSLYIAPQTDESSIIKYNLVEQEILVEFTLPQTTTTKQSKSLYNNKLVFLDS